jgi:Divergent InlB B-repeat domain/Bacterial Ig-like domain (group 2)
MSYRWFSITVLVSIAALLLIASSCAHNHDLVSIAVSPSAFTFFSPAAPGVQQVPIPLTAYGTYIHPPNTINITNQVTWASDNTQVADVSSTGQLTDGLACGVANISASFYTDGGNKNGSVVVGFMNVTVQGPVSEGCPQGTATNNLSVNVTNPADGVIVSAPAGINCGSTCSAQFATNSSVSLTATPNSGHSFGGWGSGCTSVSGNTCTVFMDTTVVVTAAFN